MDDNAQVTNAGTAVPANDTQITINQGGQQLAITDPATQQQPMLQQQQVQAQQQPQEQQQQTPASDMGTLGKLAESDKAIEQTLTAHGVDFDAVSAEYAETGTLSAATKQMLEKAGYPQTLVNGYLAGLEAQAQQAVNEITEFVGGKEQLESLRNFIAQQPQATIDNFNVIAKSGNIEQLKLVLNGFKAQMAQTYGTMNPTILGNQTAGATDNKGFASRLEMSKAINDKRYGHDMAYTQEVQNKVLNSTFIQ